ncbi:Scr1 family TA system antitoxin-like transcriptional regulator [Actinomadura sp. NPDC000600]|uniref:Scr1 family TA system antitoxin-like transcriptional regulator n=1 Tax=Actinomadura sp. NPDC000600 TaxID=3154262 RepID=UPI0033958BA4
MANHRDPLDPKISLWHFLAYALRFEREKHDHSLARCGQVIPVPFQTEDYARAFVQAGGASDVETVVAARMARQKALLSGTAGPLLLVLLDEGVLYRPVGGAEVMRAGPTPPPSGVRRAPQCDHARPPEVCRSLYRA